MIPPRDTKGKGFDALIMVRISKQDRELLEKLALADDRTLTGYCRKVLRDHLEAEVDRKRDKS